MLVLAFAACYERGSPTAPERRPATIVAETVRTTATSPAGTGLFTYRLSLTLRESVTSSKNAPELVARIKKSYPNLGMEQLLNNNAKAAFPWPTPANR